MYRSSLKGIYFAGSVKFTVDMLIDVIPTSSQPPLIDGVSWWLHVISDSQTLTCLVTWYACDWLSST